MARVTINGVTIETKGSVTITNGKVLVDGVEVNVGEIKNSRLDVRILEGTLGELKADGNVTALAVAGSVDAGGSVVCESVGRNVDAGGSVKCGDVKGNVDAGGSVSCGNVGGNVDAGGSVSYRR